MKDDNPQPLQKRAFSTTIERHAQTIMVSLITAAIMWVSLNLTVYQEQLARFEERMISLTEKIDGLIVIRNDVSDLKVRVKVLESKVESRDYVRSNK